MTGQLDLWAGRDLAPGHRVHYRTTHTPAGRLAIKAVCGCGWTAGPYTDQADAFLRAMNHGDRMRAAATGGGDRG